MRKWDLQNYEKKKEYNRNYYWNNREKQLEYRRQYYQRNKEKRAEYDKKYRQNHLAEKLAYSRKYYKENRYDLCKKTIGDYSYKRIAALYKTHKTEIDAYLLKYPFEEYGDKVIKYYLRRESIKKSNFLYDDCYDAGIVAYLYSVYICAATSKDYVIPYIKKVVRKFIMCAIVVANETKNICKENGFDRVYFDKFNGAI